MVIWIFWYLVIPHLFVKVSWAEESEVTFSGFESIDYEADALILKLRADKKLRSDSV